MQDIDHRCLEEKANDILTAIVHGMKKEEPSNHVRLAATNALFNSLEFCRANFEREVRSTIKHSISAIHVRLIEYNEASWTPKCPND